MSNTSKETAREKEAREQEEHAAREKEAKEAKKAQRNHDKERDQDPRGEAMTKHDPRDGGVDLRGLRADLLPTISGGLGGANVDQTTGKIVGVPEPQAITPGTWPSPIDGWRAAVHGVAATIVNPAPGDALLPYPTGTPIAPGSKFWLTNGYYKSATPT